MQIDFINVTRAIKISILFISILLVLSGEVASAETFARQININDAKWEPEPPINETRTLGAFLGTADDWIFDFYNGMPGAPNDFSRTFKVTISKYDVVPDANDNDTLFAVIYSVSPSGNPIELPGSYADFRVGNDYVHTFSLSDLASVGGDPYALRDAKISIRNGRGGGDNWLPNDYRIKFEQIAPPSPPPPTPPPSGSFDPAYEPNGGFDTAYTIIPGRAYEGYIWSTDDLDYFKIYASAGEIIGLSLSSLPHDYDLALYGPDRSLMASSTNAGTLAEQISEPAPVTGNFYIRVKGFEGAFNAFDPYTLLASIGDPASAPPPPPEPPPPPPPGSTDPAYEPNGSMDSAYAVSSGMTYYGYVWDYYDIDYYKIYANEGQTIDISLTSLPDNFELELFKPDRTLLAESGNSGTEPEHINRTAPVTGNYYVRVSYDWLGGAPNQSDTYALVSAVNNPAPPPPPPPPPPSDPAYEPNNTINEAYPIVSGKTYYGYMWECGFNGQYDLFDIDYFKVNVSAGQTIFAYLDSLPKNADLAVLGPSGQAIAFTATSGTVPEYIYVEAPVSGTYYIRVQPGGFPEPNYSQTDTYELTVFVGLRDTAYEPNNTKGEAYSIASDATYKGYVFPKKSDALEPQDFDHYKFEAIAGQTIDIWLTDLPKDYQLYLYHDFSDAWWNTPWIASENLGTNPEHIKEIAPYSGAYCILVKGASWSISDSYSLKATVKDASPPSGKVVVNNNALYSKSKYVTLSLSASDTGGSDLFQMRFSNDGVFNDTAGTEKWQPYATSKNWTLISANGTKRIWAQFKDQAGNISMRVSDVIFLDTHKPTSTITAPKYASSTNWDWDGFVALAWAGSDPSPSSGIASYDIEYLSAQSTSWIRWKTGTTSKHDRFQSKNGYQHDLGSTFYFRARAKDRAGNIGNWSVQDLTVVPYDQNVMSYTGDWEWSFLTQGFNPNHYFDHTLWSTTKGAKAKYAFSKAKEVALILTKRPSGGYANVYIGSTFIKRINFYSASTKYRRAISIKSSSTAFSGTLKVVVRGTHPPESRGNRVEIDGLGIRR